MLKRVLLSSALGIFCGGICLAGMYLTGRANLTPPYVAAVIADRALIGFILGITAWRTPWAFAGAVVGLAASLPVAVLDAGAVNGVRNILIFELAGGVYGVLIQMGNELSTRRSPQ